MHVVIVAPEKYPVPPPGGNSVEIYTWHMARHLARGPKVTVISRQSPSLPRREVREGVHFVRLQTGSLAAYGRRVGLVLARLRPDVVQVENRPKLLPILRPYVRQSRLILNLHSMNFLPPGRVSRLALRHADAIIINSHYVRRVLFRRFPEVNGRSFVLHPGADTRRFYPASTPRGKAHRQLLRRRFRLGTSPVVLYVGRVIPRKGVDILLVAMRRVLQRHPDAHLLVAGGSWNRPTKTYEGRLSSLARPLGSHARALGSIRHERLGAIYAAADCLVCPSQEPEALGLVNLEAMAAALPVVASAAWGIPEVVRHGENGLLVQRRSSAAALARTITELLDDPNKAHQLGLNGRKLVERYYNWNRASAQAEAIYGALLAGAARPQRSDDERAYLHTNHRHSDDGADSAPHAQTSLP